MTSVNHASRSLEGARSPWIGFWLLLGTLALIATGLPAHAANREILITTPPSAVAGSKLTVSVAATTNAGGGEQIGFFHSDYSTDGGTTWTPISYSQNNGPRTFYSVTFPVASADAKVLVRVRVAFRGGRAGDVDYTGKPIKWDTSWAKWQEPPAKYAAVPVIIK